MTPLYKRVSVFYHQEGKRSLIALKNFHQGEVIVSLSSDPSPCSEAINHSGDPNASLRKGRVVAWACITAGDEITLDYNKAEAK